jgi:uncharacterized OB-fold protein
MTNDRSVPASTPLPRPSPVSAPFWQAAREHRLELQHCSECGRWQYYPRPYCVTCLSEKLEWRPTGGRGTVYSFTVIRRASTAAFADQVPYVHAIVELDEGPHMTTNIVDCPLEQVRIGMRVQAVFEDRTDEIALVKFRPV